MKKYSVFLCLSVLTLMGCSTDDKLDSKSVVVPTYTPKTQFDKYLEREFTTPYNIQFLYRMPDIETDMNYALVPTNYQNSVKMANLLKYFCLDSYKSVAPSDFLKKYFPKTIMLIGSHAHRNNGTIVLGTAEGGLKISLYGINFLDPSNVPQLFSHYFRTIFHEFSHIMHQTVDYSKEFGIVSAKDYIGDSWSNQDSTLDIALDKGFVSTYSRKEPNEDFVELLAHYVTYSPSEWNNMLTQAGTNGKPIIEKKMGIVKSYMLDTWKINLDELRDEVQQRIQNLPNVDLDKID